MVVELNPRLIFDEYLEKVPSTSTEDFDRDAKIKEYRGVSSFREYLLIAQDRRHVEHYAAILGLEIWASGVSFADAAQL